MRVRRRLVAAVLVIVACASVGADPPGASGTSGCPATPLTVVELRSLWDGVYAGFAGMTNPRGRACYDGSSVRVIGYVDMPDGLGGISASGIRPAWLTEWGLFLYPSARSIATGHANDSYVIAVPPKLGDLNERYRHRWVVVTAHFDDPRARTCTGWGVDPPSRKEAVRVCRSILVLSSVSTTSAPDTAAADAPGGRHDARVWLLAVAALAGLGVWARRTRTSGRESKRPGA